MMGFLLFTDGENSLGALNLYSTRAGVFTQRSEKVGWLLASHAAVALSSAREYAQLHAAITTRQDIGEAIGILMERNRVNEDEAFAMLRQVSQDRNIKVRDLAQLVSHSGTLPEQD